MHTSDSIWSSWGRPVQFSEHYNPITNWSGCISMIFYLIFMHLSCSHSLYRLYCVIMSSLLSCLHLPQYKLAWCFVLQKQSLALGGDTFPLTTDGGNTLGMALRSTDSAPNPIYVSVGHKVSLQSAVTLVQHCCKYRIPEPTRFVRFYLFFSSSF